MVSFPEAIKLFYKNYTNFSDRSTRSEYWWSILWQVILFGVILIPAYPWLFDAIMADEAGVDIAEPTMMAWIGLGLGVIALLGHVLPGIAVAVRRWHDLGQTGWLYLVFAILSAIPVIGWVADVVNVVWFCLKGNEGPNKYGPDPFSPSESIFD
ncbi:DUF805 domain-containing protein [Litorimonas sp. RW-G-Af-16]|uniref:DUF805 domain-containing protein n=1 Tax=Litorimonas sp. RW-G-Af-16 TaxID=3241168 RepID=UPI00390C5A30